MAFSFRAAALAAGLALSALPAAAQSFDSLTAAQFRQVIATEPKLSIVKEDVIDGSPVFIIQFEGVRTLVSLTNDSTGKGISLLQLGFYPEGLSGRMTASSISTLNNNSQFGWFTKGGDGTVAYVNGDSLYGETAKGLTFDLILFTALYAARGSDFSGVSYEGGDASPREKLLDVNHQPAAPVGLSAETFGAMKSLAGGENLEAVFGDAQSYGALRKIANDALGAK